MTVGELIDKLRDYPQYAKVVTPELERNVEVRAVWPASNDEDGEVVVLC